MRRSLRLDVRSIHIEDVRLGNTTSVSGHTLTISNEEVAFTVLSDARIADVEVAIARPGEDVRICIASTRSNPVPSRGSAPYFRVSSAAWTP